MFRHGWMAMGCILALSVTAAEPGVKGQFVDATLAGVGARSAVRVDLTSADSLRLPYRDRTLQIPYQKINTVEYGQNVSRRYAEAILLSPVFLLAKNHKHFVTVGYVDRDG